MEKPGRLQSMGSLELDTTEWLSLSLFSFIHWRRQWQPTPVFLPGESQGRGSLVGCYLWGRTESDTTEATCSSSSSIKESFWGGSVVKNLLANARDEGDVALTPGLGRSSRGGNANPLHYSCLENPMNRGAWLAQSMGLQRVRHDGTHPH